MCSILLDIRHAGRYCVSGVTKTRLTFTYGIRWRLTDDSILSVTLPIELIEEIVSKVLKHWWHLKLVVYLSLHRPICSKILNELTL